VKALGVPYVEDINDTRHPASALTKLRTTVSVDGKRCSTFEAFLPEKFVKQQSNLKICFGAVAQRLDVAATDGLTRVQGIFVENEKSSGKTFYVKGKEVIVCGGAVASPQLLLLRYLNCTVSNFSGIGPSEELTKHGIPSKVNLSGVGKHLAPSFPSLLT
jgi:choline dehydrogenase